MTKIKEINIYRFLDKIASGYGFYITKELRTYMNSHHHLTANQVASMIIIDEGMDVLLSYDMRNDIEREFKVYFGSDYLKKEHKVIE